MGKSIIQISYHRTGAPEEYALGSEVISSNFAFGTEQLKFETQLLERNKLDRHEILGNRLAINIGNPVPYHFSEDGVWKKTIFKPGQFVLLSEGEMNEVAWDSTFKIIAISISQESLNNFAAIDQNLKFQSVRNPVTDATLEAVVGTMAGEIGRSQFLFEHASTILKSRLIENWLTKDFRLRLPKGKLDSNRSKLVIEYLNDELHETKTLEELANLVFISPYHFARMFKNTFGISPHKFQMRLKIERAKQLMQANRASASLTQIAFDLGFADQSHFSNNFKRLTGISPRQFKQMMK